MEFGALAVYCVDVGSISRGNFGWARASASAASLEQHRGGSQIVDLVGALASDVDAGRPVALGFECPLFVPVPRHQDRLGKARAGERDRPWSAGAGLGAMATGIVQEAWILAEIAERTGPVLITLNWSSYQMHPQGIFVWEAFVTGAAKKATHVEDATIAVATFLEALPDLTRRNIVHEARVVSLVGAAALWSGISSDIRLLSSPCVVLRTSFDQAVERDQQKRGH